MNASELNLATVMSGFPCANSEEFYDTDLEAMIQKYMPGYIVNYYDLDDQYNGMENVASSVLNIVNGKRLVDYQIEEWQTNNYDLVIMVVAVKLED